jgi:hypothetical protein
MLFFPFKTISADCSSVQQRGSILFRSIEKSIQIPNSGLAPTSKILNSPIKAMRAKIKATGDAHYAHGEIDLHLFDFSVFQEYNAYLKGAVPVIVFFPPKGLRHKEKMHLVQKSSLGAILGDPRLERPAIMAIWHEVVERGTSWSIDLLEEVLAIIPVNCAAWRLLFKPSYDIFFAGWGKNTPAFAKGMEDPRKTGFMEQVEDLVRHGFDRAKYLSMSAAERNQYLYGTVSIHECKSSLLKLPVEVRSGGKIVWPMQSSDDADNVDIVLASDAPRELAIKQGLVKTSSSSKGSEAPLPEAVQAQVVSCAKTATPTSEPRPEGATTGMPRPGSKRKLAEEDTSTEIALKRYAFGSVAMM